ncbi:unnamed protein product [Arctogadus glacialis]
MEGEAADPQVVPAARPHCGANPERVLMQRSVVACAAAAAVLAMASPCLTRVRLSGQLLTTMLLFYTRLEPAQVPEESVAESER